MFVFHAFGRAPFGLLCVSGAEAHNIKPPNNHSAILKASRLIFFTSGCSILKRFKDEKTEMSSS